MIVDVVVVEDIAFFDSIMGLFLKAYYRSDLAQFVHHDKDILGVWGSRMDSVLSNICLEEGEIGGASGPQDFRRLYQ